MRPIEELTALVGNPRRGDVEAVKRSLTTFGQFKPIVVREHRDDGTRVCETLMGNHTLVAARELGWDRLAQSWEDGWSDAEAKAAALADNHTSDLATNDDALLYEMLVEVRDVDPELLAATSYFPDDLDDLQFMIEAPEVAGTATSDRLEAYEAAGIRSVVLPFSAENYRRVTQMLDKLRAKFDANTNSDAIRWTLEEMFGSEDTDGSSAA